jgi:gluconolactonase
MESFKAQALGMAKYLLGEAPFYDHRTGKCSFVDIIAGKLYIIDNEVTMRMVDFGQPVGAAVPGPNPGEYVVAAKDGLYLYDGKEISPIKDLTDTYENYQRSNDAKADPKGRLWFGSVSGDDDHGPSGNLYCYDKGNVSVKQPDTKIANGMAWNGDRTKFYFSDSLEHGVFAYDYDNETGAISGKELLFEVTDGVPDGMCIDSDDNLWLAVWGGKRIEKRSSKTGELLAIVDVPAEHVTSCCFFGPELDTLFITTSGDGLTGDYDGCLFTCKVDCRGCSADFFEKD